jgi:hypothetical protein
MEMKQYRNSGTTNYNNMYVYTYSLNMALSFVRFGQMFIFKFDFPQIRYFVLLIYWTVVLTQYPFLFH